jgi:FtsP/CotA-like multicopper oxidase with cupredoxin domain
MSLAIAAVIAVVAVVLIAGSGGDEDADTEQAAATPTATSTETAAPQEASPRDTPTPTATPEPPPLLQSGKVTRLEFTKGDTVRFRVRSDSDEEIHVHGYDIEKEIPAGKPVTVSFDATIDGIFEIEFHHSEEQIGELRVQPE